MTLAALLALGVLLRRLPAGRRAIDRALAAIARRSGAGARLRSAQPERSSPPPQ
ncbi:hypothetical protein ACFV4F_08365 [Kitasatospora sp. NPDC059722]|uniref:hypothetical protein n=1 Tax=Kitasatospora sp. NPDC059722 TaxID=3346925 RepID=UPI0036A12BC6